MVENLENEFLSLLVRLSLSLSHTHKNTWCIYMLVHNYIYMVLVGIKHMSMPVTPRVLRPKDVRGLDKLIQLERLFNIFSSNNI